MLRSMKLLMVLVPLMCLAGCADSQEKVAKDTVSELKRVAKIISAVTDEASAKAAASDIDAMKPRFEALAARMKKVGEPSKELQAKLEPELRDASKEMMSKMMELMGKNPKAAEIVAKSMSDLGETMRKMDVK